MPNFDDFDLPFDKNMTVEEMFYSFHSWKLKCQAHMNDVRHKVFVIRDIIRKEQENEAFKRNLREVKYLQDINDRLDDVLRSISEGHQNLTRAAINKSTATTVIGDLKGRISVAIGILLENPHYARKKVDWIKEVRTITRLGLKEAKEAVDIAQQVVEESPELRAVVELSS